MLLTVSRLGGLVSLGLLVALAPTAAQPARAAGTITVAIVADWPPFYTIGKNGRPAGFAVDLFDAVAARAGLVPTYRTYATFDEVREAVLSGQVDATPNMGVVDGRNFLFTAPIGAFAVGVFVRKSNPVVRSVSDVRGRVATIEANIGETLVAGLPGAEAISVATVQEALFRLLAGEVDALIHPSPVVWTLARASAVDHQIVELSPALAEVKRAIAVTPGRTDLQLRLNEAVQAFVASADYQALYRRWHLQPEPFWTGRRVGLVALFAFVVTGLVGAGVRFRVLRRFASVRGTADERIRFQAHLLDVIAEAVIATDIDGKVLFWNQFAETLYGWTSDEATGRPLTELTTLQGTAGDAGTLLTSCQDEGRWTGERMVSRRDGTTFPALLTNTAICNDAGAVVGMVGVSADLSGPKQLEEQLRQSQKMEGIGQLAAGVAHDFNNLLTVILGTTELALADLPADAPIRADLDEITRAASRAAALTQQLLAFSRKQVSLPRVLNLNAVLLDTERMLKRLIGEHITLTIEPGGDLGNVEADPTQIEQVILNLVVNSRDAMPNGGTLTITTSRVVLDRVAASNHAGMAQGPHVVLSVTDTGAGMDDATRRRAFEPFFTTKEPGLGTGLGLSTVYGIVNQSGGTVEIHSKPGRGTTFRVYLPEVVAPASEVPVVLAGPAPGAETVLVVEDESAVRLLVERTLMSAGYTVLSAASPADALRLAGHHGHRIHLLLTDVVLPGMQGPELASRIVFGRPDTLVLYMSGYAGNGPAHHGVVFPGTPLLSKPFTAASLTNAVRQVLDAA